MDPSSSYNPGQNSLEHQRKSPLVALSFKVRWHDLFFPDPLPTKSMTTDWCESWWFEINIELEGEEKTKFIFQQNSEVFQEL